ncbi:MAG: [FeFe] hydrogenase H-cluster maturation GTPase HydF [Oscillospiraceae bacterium]
MEKTPNFLRRHVVLVGDTNAGKSTLFNTLTGQENAIVSPTPGTTTDPVSKAMELVPYGPIVLVDTAGMGDESALGAERMRKSRMACRRADAAIYVADATAFDREAYASFQVEKMPHLLVLTKCDLAGEEALYTSKEQYPEALQMGSGSDVGPLREKLTALLSALAPEEDALLGDLVPPGGTVVLVTPIDSEAPKGRLIMPQVQTLRDCLDHGIKAMVCREFELEEALKSLSHVDLVVTDSQAFAYVEQRVPAEIPLTSFSMLLARQKGNFPQLLAGAKALGSLPEGARILMLEGCTHNSTHEDIGRKKIPALLRKKTGKALEFDYRSGYDFPEDLSCYHMAVQCGSCMINRREIASRLGAMESAGLPVTNYGVLLAWGTGILDRARAIFPT